jgi:dipeptidyl aminopeptidase/acylaminoacyl peptidase
MTATPFHDLDDYIALPRVSRLAVSPDGTRVVTTVTELNEKRTKYVSAVWEVDPIGQRPARRLIRGAKGESSTIVGCGNCARTTRSPRSCTPATRFATGTRILDRENLICSGWIWPGTRGRRTTGY